jgi:hypothetical protein
MAALLRLGALQSAQGGRPVAVAELIDIQSRLEWGYIQAMGTRELVTVKGGCLSLTRGGWATYHRHRS